MTDTILLAGGSPTPVEFIVTADQVTILGDGTTEHPLHTTPGSVAVTTDGETILGDGTLADPIRMAIPLIAAARVDGFNAGVSFQSNSGFDLVTRSSAGVYELTLSNPPVDRAQTVPLVARQVTSAGSVTASVLVNGRIQVNAFNSSDAAQDIQFSIAVFSATLA